jgi:glycosyltransferase involved in cell wall biosynthesis
VLWIAPNLNDYKARFLDVLMSDGGPRLTVLAGAAESGIGHRYGVERHVFRRVDVPVRKSRFGFSPRVFWGVWRELRAGAYDFVLMPLEKKHLLMVVGLIALRPAFGYKLVTYNHPCLRNGRGQVTRFNKWLTRQMFRLYDHIIFYTEGSRRWAVDNGLVHPEKATYANNTLDTEAIWANWRHEVRLDGAPRILFIGRLVAAKKLDLLMAYYAELRRVVPDLRLDVVGDGPESGMVKQAAGADESITWHGALTDETQIAAVMRTARAVFVPGHSGLSIVHAFCYGKPYITTTGADVVQPPELEYLVDDVNGLRLDSGLDEDVRRIAALLKDESRYAAMCDAALTTARGLSVRRWKEQIEAALASCVRPRIGAVGDVDRSTQREGPGCTAGRVGTDAD